MGVLVNRAWSSNGTWDSVGAGGGEKGGEKGFGDEALERLRWVLVLSLPCTKYSYCRVKSEARPTPAISFTRAYSREISESGAEVLYRQATAEQSHLQSARFCRRFGIASLHHLPSSLLSLSHTIFTGRDRTSRLHSIPRQSLRHTRHTIQHPPPSTHNDRLLCGRALGRTSPIDLQPSASA